jgi:hypothetical protein
VIAGWRNGKEELPELPRLPKIAEIQSNQGFQFSIFGNCQFWQSLVVKALFRKIERPPGLITLVAVFLLQI